MKPTFLKLPLDIQALITGNHKRTLQLKSSVIQHIQLLVQTTKGEFPANPEYGCSIQEQLLKLSSPAHLLKTDLEAIVLNCITKHEKRLHQTDIQVTLERSLKNNSHQQSFAHFTIRGHTIKPVQPFEFEFKLKINPVTFKL
ncbi:gene 25-like lysozyme [Chitinophaga dinghuensis]|uniref:Gene 25-like lysozyme n=1 Tax=Chitinophaga dinghuensis TaxID=1539050 RepID=A0A327W403_9BACT|nr:GPW/gp25 family protein [Chitinophaga dinghuensis]RAJ83522.1 gene 25-like lysozyme [Chitinophaga dinghuensis]